ncbi:uncharacterized protein B4U80_03159 [Leptotrombidium deliense]|uniref:valine--tRNA ligase n=1 Tax=Leptotrombidium deliense TaxID=299467 RepID=A0A443SL87_9ACAR|nr:uncharacterized protein B4U80_03159 [Leptotrombidium deliense]
MMHFKRVAKYRFKTILCNACFRRHFADQRLNEELFKKHIGSPLSRHPQPSIYEPFWYSFWERSELFKPQTDKLSSELGIKDRFSMILPPPNITGDLHLGHALTVCIQDSIFRYKKMMDHSQKCIWIPGFDHAGIATQLILDKLCFASKGKRSNELSKEEFISTANEWKNNRMNSIREQLKMLGASLDFSREYFTLNSNLSESVTEAFIRLFDKGLIYRAEMMVNWSFYLNSTISDIEIVWEHIHKPKFLKVPGFNENVEFGFLHKFAYPVVDGKDGEEIVVATTRIESMLSDVAVAIHPQDERYSSLIGRHLLHPLTGQKLKVIADERSDPNFGTGAVKITPTESEIDLEVANEHNLTGESSLDEYGFVKCPNIKDEYSFLNGTHRYSAKIKIIDLLNKLGLYRGKVEHQTKVPLCSRSGDVIEKRILPQWFLKSEPVLSEIQKVIENNEIEIIPKRQKNKVFDWGNGKDWCISRQIMWGHRIPAYNVFTNGKNIGFVAAKNEKEAMEKAERSFKLSHSEIKLIQDKDVLDTWFSSALLPFSVLGWPNESSLDYKSFYPLNLMETGVDILTFWVIRMLMLGKYLTGEWPFKKVILHGMVRDADGRKMTKSLGNVIDPKDVIQGITPDQLKAKTLEYKAKGILDESMLKAALKNQEKLFPEGIVPCSSDSLRMSLFEMKTATHEALKLSVNKIIANRNCVNKMWQTFNFFNLMLEKKPHSHKWVNEVSSLEIAYQLSNMDKWILSRLATFVETCHESIQTADFANIHSAINTFWVENMCDFYLESLKLTFYAQNRDDEAISQCLNVLAVCLKNALITIHPFMPFVTEELFQRLKDLTNDSSDQTKSILLEEYPKNELWSKFKNSDHENTMNVVHNIIRKIRDVKNKLNSTADEEKEVVIHVIAEPSLVQKITLFADIFPKFTRSQLFIITSEQSPQDSSSQWLNIKVEGVTLAVKPSVILVSKRLESILHKQNKLKDKLQILENKPKSQRGEIKKAEMLDELKQLQTDETEIRTLMNVLDKKLQNKI